VLGVKGVYQAFLPPQAVQDPTILDECGLDEKTKEVLLENIQQKLTQQAVKIRADIEVSCYTYEGTLRSDFRLQGNMSATNAYLMFTYAYLMFNFLSPRHRRDQKCASSRNRGRN